MIALLTGEVVSVATNQLVLSIGGVGLQVHCPPTVTSRVGDRVSLHTHLVVREDSLTIYGFSTSEDRDAFVSLLSVSGVGPRTALAAVATLPGESLRSAIASQDAKALQRIPGIGAKGAARLVLELSGRLPKSGEPTLNESVQEALVGLGWSQNDATSAAAYALAQGSDDLSTVLRTALTWLGRR